MTHIRQRNASFSFPLWSALVSRQVEHFLFHLQKCGSPEQCFGPSSPIPPPPPPRPVCRAGVSSFTRMVRVIMFTGNMLEDLDIVYTENSSGKVLPTPHPRSAIPASPFFYPELDSRDSEQGRMCAIEKVHKSCFF